ncbi:hypothetical protein BKA65DRAFT_575215 [Rhexocercosporidium sp. MPI-PUGE-AT-0058]|nr:hypothetical protein BKA65DRAFT_575215 [Rhexocercosporidium sp. MPI-PUGE-AT-0058]
MRSQQILLALLTITIIWITTLGATAQQTWIDDVPGYTLLAPCAERRLSVIVRDMSSGCGSSTSSACFCTTEYAPMNTIIAKAVSSECRDGVAANSALEVFASYCDSTPIITIATAHASTTPTPLSIAAATSTLPSTWSAELSNSATTMKVESQSILSSSTLSLAVTPGLSSIANTTVNQTPAAASTGDTACSTWCRRNARSRVADPVIAGITLGTIAVVALAVCFVVWLSRQLRARNTQRQRQSTPPPDAAQGRGEEAFELGGSGNPPSQHKTSFPSSFTAILTSPATSTTALLEKVHIYRSTNPKTSQSIDNEKASLQELRSIHENLPPQESALAKRFQITISLIENMLDKFAVSPATDPDLRHAMQLCEDLDNLSKRIYTQRLAARQVACFYAGQVHLAKARLLHHLNPGSTSPLVEESYTVALRELMAAAKQVHGDERVPDREMLKISGRALNACAYIVQMCPACANLEPALLVQHEYVEAKQALSTVHERGDLVAKMLNLDEKWVHQLAGN